MKIRTGDTVVVITGKDKGKTGKVLRTLPPKGRVVVGGVNMRTKHMRKTPQRAGQRIQFEGGVHVSNVMLVDAKSGKRSRVGFAVDEKGRKKRIAKRSGQAIVVVQAEREGATQISKERAQAPREEVKRAPAKAPFWKRIGFGADAMEDAAEMEQTPHGKEDHSVPDEGQASGRRSHGRGS